jgi:hypothetical protein
MIAGSISRPASMTRAAQPIRRLPTPILTEHRGRRDRPWCCDVGSVVRHRRAPRASAAGAAPVCPVLAPATSDGLAADLAQLRQVLARGGLRARLVRWLIGLGIGDALAASRGLRQWMPVPSRGAWPSATVSIRRLSPSGRSVARWPICRPARKSRSHSAIDRGGGDCRRLPQTHAFTA